MSRRAPIPAFPAHLLLAAWLVAAGTAGSAEEPAVHLVRRAALIQRLAALVEFPEGSFTNQAAPIRLVVLGADSVAEPLAKAAAEKKSSGRPLIVSRANTVEGVAGAHIVVFGASPAAVVEGVMKSVRDKPVLTLGGSAAFLAKGGIVRTTVHGGDLAFEINIDAAKRAAERGLRMDPALFRLGTAVRE